MKILMIASYLPYPLDSGGHVRLYNLLKELHNLHEITLVCEMRDNQSGNDIKEIEKICYKVITVKRRKQWSMLNLFKAGITAHSFLITGHTNEEMRKKIKELLDTNQFDLIHAETFYIAQNIPSANLSIVLAEHNIEYQVYSLFAKNANFLLRPFLYYDAYKLRKEEQNIWKKVSKLVAVSEDDKDIMQTIGVEVEVVSNGVNPDQFNFKDISKAIAQKEKKILFIGDFKWLQNRDSLSWIIKDIWPKIRSKIIRQLTDQKSKIDIKLWIVGKNIPDSIKKLTNDPDILFDEKSSSRLAEEIFQEAYILLSPIRVGGGTSYKILESMSVGTPVIMTPLSAKSLHVSDRKEGLIGETSEELAKNSLELLSNSTLYEKLSKNGRVLIEKNYTWKSISKKLNEVYESVV